jgi:hypothetical protein
LGTAISCGCGNRQHKRVHVRHHQRYVRLQRKQTAEIDNQTPGVGRVFDIRRTGFAPAAKSQLGLGPVKLGGVLTITDLPPKRRCSPALSLRASAKSPHRELAFSKSFEQGFAYGARCAQYGNIPAFRHGGLLQK